MTLKDLIGNTLLWFWQKDSSGEEFTEVLLDEEHLNCGCMPHAQTAGWSGETYKPPSPSRLVRIYRTGPLAWQVTHLHCGRKVAVLAH